MKPIRNTKKLHIRQILFVKICYLYLTSSSAIVLLVSSSVSLVHLSNATSFSIYSYFVLNEFIIKEGRAASNSLH
jgi:hypothetical protein